MVIRPQQVLSAVLFVSGLVAAEGVSGKDPCHPRDVRSETGTTCEQIALPPGICSACPVGVFDSGGAFADCTSTMSLTNSCIDAMQLYVDNNPCDTNRAQWLGTYRTADPNSVAYEEARQRLDWFLFSVCEQGCDCLPQEQADRNTRMIDVGRGHCQAHAYYHICTLMPDIRLLRILDGSGDQDVSSLPRACDYVRAWFNSPESDGWQDNPKYLCFSRGTKLY